MSKTAIIEAVRKLDLARIQELLRAKPELVRVIDPSERNLLQLACCITPAAAGVSAATQVRVVSFFLGYDFEIDALVGKDKCTALFFAVARAQNHALVKLLLSRGAVIMKAPGGGLFAAGWWDDPKMIGILLDAGAEIEDVADVTPFAASWGWGRFKAAKYFVERGANVNYRDKKGRTALWHGVDKEFDPALLKWLVKHGASPDIVDAAGVSARSKASRKRDKKFLAALG